MNFEKDILPDNIEELKTIVLNLQNYKSAYDSLKNEKDKILNDNKFLQNRLSKRESDYRELQNAYRVAIGRFFSPKKDKVSFEQTGQMPLFNEAETYIENEDADKEVNSAKTDENKITVKSYERKSGGKRSIPDDIPSEEIIYELGDKEKACKCCGKIRPVIGEDRSEELEIIPEQLKKIVRVVKKYGPCQCDGFLDSGESEVIKASKPERFIPYSIASAGLVAYAIDYKYNYALPYYRLSSKFEAIGIDISRATLCNWTMLAAEKCASIYELMIDHIRRSEIIQMDETRVQVLKEDGKTAESLSYMWVMKAGPHNRKLTVFHYAPTRSGEIPLNLLKGFTGYLQTDGYEGYSKAVLEYKLVHVGCLAHIRRKFVDAHKANKNSKTAKAGVLYINRIYSLESKLRNKKLLPEDFIKKRKEEMRPLLDEFKTWLDDISKIILPSSESGKAVSYALNQWDKFINFIDHHDLTPDNNSVENAIRPFAVGRKNWLFSNTPRGAMASAVMYSLVESAKNNNLPVYNYLKYLFTKLPEAKSREDIEKLLPCNLSAGDIII